MRRWLLLFVAVLSVLSWVVSAETTRSTPKGGITRYIDSTGKVCFVKKPWMVPSPYQGQGKISQLNPFVVYDLNGSYNFAIDKVLPGMRISCVGSDEILKPYGMVLPEDAPEKLVKEADEYLDKLLMPAQDVRVVFDRTQRDEEGNAIGYLFWEGRFINAELLQAGKTMFDAPDANPRYGELLKQPEAVARDLKIGVWHYLWQLEEAKRRAMAPPPNYVSVGNAELPVMGDTETGFYHTLFCKNKGPDPLTRQQAEELGLKPCPYCQFHFDQEDKRKEREQEAAAAQQKAREEAEKQAEAEKKKEKKQTDAEKPAVNNEEKKPTEAEKK